MMEMTTWTRNPWSVFDELEALQNDMNRAFSNAAYDRAQRRSGYPLMNVWSSPDGLVIDAELPGVDPKDVDISVMGDQLTLRGKVNPRDPGQGEGWYRTERPSGEFERTLQLPFRPEPGSVKATYKHGVLRLDVPRSEQEKPRKIAVEAA